jgi:hypothetical protein
VGNRLGKKPFGRCPDRSFRKRFCPWGFGFQPFYAWKGGVKLLVSSDDYKEAKEVIKEYEANEQKPLEDDPD